MLTMVVSKAEKEFHEEMAISITVDTKSGIVFTK